MTWRVLALTLVVVLAVWMAAAGGLALGGLTLASGVWVLRVLVRGQWERM